MKDGASLEDTKTFVTVIVKDAKKYATTGGGDSKCGLRATPRNHKCRILPTPSKLALSTIRREKLKTTFVALERIALDASALEGKNFLPFLETQLPCLRVGKRLCRDVYGKERDELPIARDPARFAVRI